MSFAYTALAVAVIGLATSLTFGLISAANQRKAARAQMEATAMDAKIKATQRAKQIRKIASQQKSSFLHSGISLTGEGDTADALSSDTFDVGAEDLDNIRENALTKGKNIEYQTRANLMKTYGQMASDVSNFATSAMGAAGTASKATQATDAGKLSSGMEGMGSFGSKSSSFGGGTISPGATGRAKDMNFNFDKGAF